MTTKDNKLYIPLGVKTEREIFNGFGKKQLFQAIIGTLCFGVVAALFFLLSRNIAFTLVALMFGAVGSVMMTTKDQSNLSVVDQVQNMLRFARGQKVYPYKFKTKWRNP
jgi:hypothetical protein